MLMEVQFKIKDDLLSEIQNLDTTIMGTLEIVRWIRLDSNLF